MPDSSPKPPLDERFRAAASRVEAAATQVGSVIEQDLRKLVTYVNDEVVPEVRRNGSSALRAAATELQRLAQRMEDATKPKS